MSIYKYVCVYKCVCVCVYVCAHLGCFFPGAIVDESKAMIERQVEVDQRAMLHTESLEGGAINLEGEVRVRFRVLSVRWEY